MRKRIYTKDLLPARARLNQRLVQTGRTFHLCHTRIELDEHEFLYIPYTIRRRYFSDDEVMGKHIINWQKIVKARYKEVMEEFKDRINTVLGDVYVVIPHYPECSTSDIIAIIKQLHDEPTDIVAVEICKRFNL